MCVTLQVDDTHLGVVCPLFLFRALRADIAASWKRRPAAERMWVCVTESQLDPARAAIIRQKYAEKERERR